MFYRTLASSNRHIRVHVHVHFHFLHTRPSPILTSTTRTLSSSLKPPYPPIDGTLSHNEFQAQLLELQAERNDFFGPDSESSSEMDSVPKSAPKWVTSKPTTATTEASFFRDAMAKQANQGDKTKLCEQSMRDLASERDSIYSHDEDMISAWGNSSGGSKVAENRSSDFVNISNVDEINRILKLKREGEDQLPGEDEAEMITRLVTNGSSDNSDTFGFSHLSTNNETGSTEFEMVDVSHKLPTIRTATASAIIMFPPVIASAFKSSISASAAGSSAGSGSSIDGPSTAKGNVFSVARLAGIMGGKQTSNLIPLCHPLMLNKIDVQIAFSPLNQYSRVQVLCSVKCTGLTGVEMEAMTGATVACLTVYDMVKGLSHEVVIGEIKLLAKEGGERVVRDGRNVG